MSSSVTSCDVAIIGGGIIGTSIANELGKRELDGKPLRTVLIEQSSDLCAGATRANSGIIHGDYSAKHGSLKASLLVRGNRMWPQIARNLNIPFRRIGALVLAFGESQHSVLEELKENGRLNGREPEYLTRDQALVRQPNLGERVSSALFDPDVGIISPYEAAFALGQQAGRNGVEIILNCRVTGVQAAQKAAAPGSSDFPPDHRSHILRTNTDRTIEARIVINCAGAGAADLVVDTGDSGIVPRFRRGQYLLFRRGSAAALNHVLFQTPGPMGKGILVTPTVWGNIMIGPNAEQIDDPEDTKTTRDGLEDIFKRASQSYPSLDPKMLLRDFAGIRSGIEGGDFAIFPSQKHRSIIHLAGIDSPGLSAAPAIASEVIKHIHTLLGDGALTKRSGAEHESRWYRGPDKLVGMSDILPLTRLEVGEPRRIVCRCEQVTEEVIDHAAGEAEDAGLNLSGTDSVKLRTRAGMGACQGQFCRPRVISWLSDRYARPDWKPEEGRLPSPVLTQLRNDLIKKTD